MRLPSQSFLFTSGVEGNEAMEVTRSLPLHGQRVLVVEDNYLIAQELTEALERNGADVIGPVSTLAGAWRLAQENHRIDAAVLDVNLRGEMIWPVADFLSRCNIKLVFATGYSADVIKERYGSSNVVEKPIMPSAIVRLLTDDGLPSRPDSLPVSH